MVAVRMTLPPAVRARGLAAVPLPDQVMARPPEARPLGPDKVRLPELLSTSETLTWPLASRALVVSLLPWVSALAPARPSSDTVAEPLTVTVGASLTGVMPM